MGSNLPDRLPATDVAGQSPLTGEQVAFARVLGAALAERWQAHQHGHGHDVPAAQGPSSDGPDSLVRFDPPTTSSG